MCTYALPRTLAMCATEIEVIRDSIFRSSSSLGKVLPVVGPGHRPEPVLPAIRWSVDSSRLEARDERMAAEAILAGWSGIDVGAGRWFAVASFSVVETRRLELLTLSLQRRRSAN